MYNRMILTGGISLFTNRTLNPILEEGYSDFFKIDEKLDDEKIVLMDEIVAYLKGKLATFERHDFVSAECSMVATLQKGNRLIEQPVITLFHTDTFKGTAAAILNKWLLETYFQAQVKLVKLYDLDVNNRMILTRALGRYLSDLSDALQEGEPNSTCFAPIGGYKVMTSLGYLVGALHHYPTAYLHEGSNILHEIPPVQLNIDESFIERNHGFLKRLLKEDFIEIDTLTQEEKRIIDDQPTFFSEEDKHVYLNPFGRFLCDQDKYYKYFKSHVYIEKNEKEKIDKRYKNYWPVVYREVNQLIYQHANPSEKYFTTLYHEKGFHMLKGKEYNYHIFKGGNAPVFRATWNYDTRKDAYFIAKVWFDHNECERESFAEIGLLNSNEQWIDITTDLYTH